ncbi:alpha/beta fold hydrolase [Paenibacillus solani]|uniref:alpha/beta fold hydrolase n=1 Tax=Paenibacillus solani TaxID=1705565 RepID=UPI003D2B3F36
MNRTVKRLIVGDLSLEYTIVGTGEEILVFHGGHSSCHEEFGYKTLLSAGYSVITPSRAGYSGTSTVDNLKTTCGIYRALLDHLEVAKVHIIAVSAGGPTGICFASMYPERVASLTLQSAVTKPWLKPTDTGYKMGQLMFRPGMEKGIWKMLATLNNLLPRLTFRMMFSSFSSLRFPDIREIIDEQTIEEFRKMNNRQRSYSGFLIDMDQTQVDYTNELKSILAPTLIQHSKNDRLVSLTHVEHAERFILHVEVDIQDSWGHLIWIGKHSCSFNERLLHFLSNHPIHH